jgi:hypothetical protein
MEPELMSQGEIALLARVTKPAVMTWRRRYPDFPVLVPGSGGQPLFRADEVVTWLLDTGLGNAEPETLRAEQSLHTLSAYARRHGGRRAITTLGAALCLRHLADRALPSDLVPLARRLDPDDELLLTEIIGAPEPANLSQVVEHLIEAAFDAGRAHEFLLGNSARLGWTELGTDALTPHLLTLIRIASEVPGRLRSGGHLTIGDPYGRSGDLLAALLSGQEPEALSFTVAQPDPALGRLVRRRLLLAGVPEFNSDVVPDDLNDEFADVDLIVTRLPYQPAELRDKTEDLSKISDIADRLGPGCTAIVVGPATSLVDALREPSAITKRAELLTSGLVEAVVRLRLSGPPRPLRRPVAAHPRPGAGGPGPPAAGRPQRGHSRQARRDDRSRRHPLVARRGLPA